MRAAALCVSVHPRVGGLQESRCHFWGEPESPSPFWQLSTWPISLCCYNPHRALLGSMHECKGKVLCFLCNCLINVLGLVTHHVWGGIRGALPEPIKAPFYELIIILTPAWGPGGSLAGAKEQKKLAHPYRTDILDPLSHCEPWLDWMSSTRKTQTPCPVHVHDSKWIPESAPGSSSNDWYHSWRVQLVWCL